MAAARGRLFRVGTALCTRCQVRRCTDDLAPPSSGLFSGRSVARTRQGPAPPPRPPPRPPPPPRSLHPSRQRRRPPERKPEQPPPEPEPAEAADAAVRLHRHVKPSPSERPAPARPAGPVDEGEMLDLLRDRSAHADPQFHLLRVLQRLGRRGHELTDAALAAALRTVPPTARTQLQSTRVCTLLRCWRLDEHHYMPSAFRGPLAAKVALESAAKPTELWDKIPESVRWHPTVVAAHLSRAPRGAAVNVFDTALQKGIVDADVCTGLLLGLCHDYDRSHFAPTLDRIRAVPGFAQMPLPTPFYAALIGCLARAHKSLAAINVYFRLFPKRPPSAPPALDEYHTQQLQEGAVPDAGLLEELMLACSAEPEQAKLLVAEFHSRWGVAPTAVAARRLVAVLQQHQPGRGWDVRAALTDLAGSLPIAQWWPAFRALYHPDDRDTDGAVWKGSPRQARMAASLGDMASVLNAAAELQPRGQVAQAGQEAIELLQAWRRDSPSDAPPLAAWIVTPFIRRMLRTRETTAAAQFLHHATVSGVAVESAPLQLVLGGLRDMGTEGVEGTDGLLAGIMTAVEQGAVKPTPPLAVSAAAACVPPLLVSGQHPGAAAVLAGMELLLPNAGQGRRTAVLASALLSLHYQNMQPRVKALELYVEHCLAHDADAVTSLPFFSDVKATLLGDQLWEFLLAVSKFKRVEATRLSRLVGCVQAALGDVGSVLTPEGRERVVVLSPHMRCFTKAERLSQGAVPAADLLGTLVTHPEQPATRVVVPFSTLAELAAAGGDEWLGERHEDAPTPLEDLASAVRANPDSYTVLTPAAELALTTVPRLLAPLLEQTKKRGDRKDWAFSPPAVAATITPSMQDVLPALPPPVGYAACRDFTSEEVRELVGGTVLDEARLLRGGSVEASEAEGRRMVAGGVNESLLFGLCYSLPRDAELVILDDSAGLRRRTNIAADQVARASERAAAAREAALKLVGGAPKQLGPRVQAWTSGKLHSFHRRIGVLRRRSDRRRERVTEPEARSSGKMLMEEGQT